MFRATVIFSFRIDLMAKRQSMVQLKSGKAAGIDGIPPKIWKDGGPALDSNFHEFLVCSWEQGKPSRDLRDAIFVTLYYKTREKVRLLELPRDHSAHHCRKDPP